MKTIYKIKFITTFLFLFPILFSCDALEQTTVSKFKVEQLSFEDVSSEGADVQIKFISTDVWVAESEVDWIEISDASGKGSEKSQVLPVRVSPNVSTSARVGKVVITSGKISKSVTISQQAGEELPEPEPDPKPDPEPEPEPECVAINTITKDGEYLVKGTVVAAGSTAYILADETGAVLVYDVDHDRRVMEVVMVRGTASRYNNRNTNVYQLIPSETEMLSTDASWSYDPQKIDGAAMGEMLGKTASCIEVEISGTLRIDGKYINIIVEGISNKVSVYYVDAEDYTLFDGKQVTVKGYVTGTYNFLYLLPYSVVENQTSDPDPDPDPEPDPEMDLIEDITSDGIYSVQGTVVAVGSNAYILADNTGAILVYQSGHGRSLKEVVKIDGNAYRYRGYKENVMQLVPSSTQLVSTGASWNYNPQVLTAATLDSMVGQTASCVEVQFEGSAYRSENYINFSVDGAACEASLSYIWADNYDYICSKKVRVKGYVTGTNSYLKVLPYDIEILGSAVTPDPDPEPDPEPEPDNNDPRGKKWMELPAMNDSNLGYYYHDFDMNGNTYRNYSFGWDDSNKVAIWMAYPLCSFYSDKKINRTDEWALDPLLGDASPYPGPGYAGDYDRGHQVPSADRLCCADANKQTFYGTNMTAQSNPFNGGPWGDLEGAVRDFRSDTTYVVTGCYVEDSNEWTTDTNGMRLKVPTAYFKAVLVLNNGTWTGGAYWSAHKNYDPNYNNWAISIDELEQKTGLDLFVNLPEKIGQSAAAAIEAAQPGDFKWWR